MRRTLLQALCKIGEGEHRNVIGRPKKFQIVDAMGMVYGALFIYSAVTNRLPAWLQISIGATMVYIHSERYFYAPQTPRELV